MNWLTNLFQAIAPAIQGIFGGGDQQHGGGQNATAAPAQGGGGFMNSIFPGGTNSGLTGLGIMGLGQALSPKLKAPDFNGMQSVQNLQNFNSSPHSLDPAIQQSIQNSANIQNEQQLRNLRDTYKNARPGTDYTTDSAYQRDLSNLNRNMQMNTSDAMANASLQSNQQQLGNMTNLANLDVGKSMAQYGQQAAEKQNFNQGFGNVGSMFLQKGIGMPDFSSIQSLFGGQKKTGQQ